MRKRRRRFLAIAVASAWLLMAPASAQIPEYDFYSAFRGWMMSLPQQQRMDRVGMLEQYRQRLSTDAVPAAEIERRLTLLRTRRDALEADFWNRFFTSEKGYFNREQMNVLRLVAQKDAVE